MSDNVTPDKDMQLRVIYMACVMSAMYTACEECAGICVYTLLLHNLQLIKIQTNISDIVMWDNSKVHLVELTVPHESGLEEASQRKMSKYADLAASCKQNGFSTTLATVQGVSRGFLHRPSLDNTSTSW